MKLQVNNIKISSWKKVWLDGWSYEDDMTDNIAICGLDVETRRLVLMCLAGCLKPNGGSVYVDGKDIYKQLDWYKQKIGFGEIKKVNELVDELTVLENIELVCKAKNEYFVRKDWLTLLSKLEIERYTDTMLLDCNPFVRMLLGMACAFVGNPQIVFFDEPLGDLNLHDRRKFWQMFFLVCEEKKVVFTVRDQNDIESIQAKIINLEQK